MRSWKTVAATLLVVTSTAVFASVGALAGGAPVISASSVMPDETGSGWYLRGDVGGTANLAPSMSWQSTTYGNLKAGGGGTFDAGVGYRFTENLRSDVTLDLLTSHQIKGYLNSTDDDHLSQTSTAVLLNGYYDLVKYMRLSPYIGAGIGLARVSNGSLTRELSGTPTYTFAANTQVELAAAAMTGVSVDIGPGLQADIGYRFLWIGGTRSGTESTGALQGPVNIGDTGSHQFRLGLKYFVN